MAAADDKQKDLDRDRVGHEGHALTTDQGVKVGRTDDSLTAGDRGPTLIEDFHFREKFTRGSAADFADGFLRATAAHRHFNRDVAAVPA